MKATLLIVLTTAAVAHGAVETPAPPTPGSVRRGNGWQPIAPALQEGAQPAANPFASPQAMHAEFLQRFEASPGFGLSRVIRPVFLAPAPALVWNGASYPVTPPELIGLEDDPIAYAPREHGHRFFLNSNTNLTRREVRKQFKHRPLTALETNAVLALRAGRDLVVLTNDTAPPEAAFERLWPTPPDLFVLGALRAGKTCAQCHQCAEGTLLGAFAFNLKPMAAPPGPAPGPPGIRSNVLSRLASVTTPPAGRGH